MDAKTPKEQLARIEKLRERLKGAGIEAEDLAGLLWLTIGPAVNRLVAESIVEGVKVCMEATMELTEGRLTHRVLQRVGKDTIAMITSMLANRRPKRRAK